MEAHEILEQAKEGKEAPESWIILPLIKRKVAWGIAGWGLGALLGITLLVIILPIMIPYNFQHGPAVALFSAIFIAIFLFIAGGSLWALFVDLVRLRQARNHIIVITPEAFIKQEHQDIIEVPLTSIRNVTVRGRAKPDRTAPKAPINAEIKGTNEHVLGFLFGRGFTQTPGQRKKSMRTPTSLAFIDSRTNREVLVVNDVVYGDPYMIAALLRKYTANVQQLV